MIVSVLHTSDRVEEYESEVHPWTFRDFLCVRTGPNEVQYIPAVTVVSFTVDE